MIAELEKDVDVLYIETPTNPLMLEFDIEKLANLAHAKGAKVVVDNTFYSPIYQRPIEDGADIVLHSATNTSSAQSISVKAATPAKKSSPAPNTEAKSNAVWPY